VVLVSPTNQILLLHRVRTSSSFPSAHVFPGGNVSELHDGYIPPSDHPDRHKDGSAYRLAAIRETFEESGILLARNNGFGRLIEVPDAEREAGRRAVHGGEVKFIDWLARKGGRPDLGKSMLPVRAI
jgi:8-oxo-dGTP pyrophosphatase MutT (NUDIX family)